RRVLFRSGGRRTSGAPRALTNKDPYMHIRSTDYPAIQAMAKASRKAVTSSPLYGTRHSCIISVNVGIHVAAYFGLTIKPRAVQDRPTNADQRCRPEHELIVNEPVVVPYNTEELNSTEGSHWLDPDTDVTHTYRFLTGADAGWRQAGDWQRKKPARALAATAITALKHQFT